MVPFAHASDGGGSIRNPASQSGVIGLKPTRGRISLGPDIGDGWAGLVNEFAVCRSVRDTARLLDAVEGAMPGDPYFAPPPARPYREEISGPPGRLRVGLLESLGDVVIAPECREAVTRAGRLLEGLGHDVEIAQPDALASTDLSTSVIAVIASAQARDMERFGEILGRALGREDVDSDNWAVTEIGQKVTATDYQRGVESFHRFSRNMAAWWAGGFDLLVTPTIPEPPPPLGELVPDPAEPLKGFMRSGALTPFLIPFNITGQPAISLPLHWNEASLPIGVQLVGAYAREDVLLGVSAQLEAAAPWADRRPPIHAAR
jgi:amidase